MSGGVLKWYAGDLFDLQVEIELQDQFGKAFDIDATHTVTFVFRNQAREIIYELQFQEITDNTVVLRFTEGVTALFPKGHYTYDVIYQGVGRRTLARNAPILVE